MPCTAASSSTKEQVCEYQIVLIDFGKVTEKNNGKKYNLSFSEKLHYHLHYRHIAPEIIDGTMKQSIFSDIYSAGRIMRIICQGERLERLDKKAPQKSILLSTSVHLKTLLSAQ